MAGKVKSASRKRAINNTIVHIVLAILAAIWVFPILWVIMTSFRAEQGSYVSTFFPKSFTIDNYVRLFTDTAVLNFPKMFMNTLIIAICSCILSTFYTLAVSYCLSRLKFKLRKPYMNMAMILGLFPGFMSMIAVILYLKGSWPDRGRSDPSGADPRLLRRRGTRLPDCEGFLRYRAESNRRSGSSGWLHQMADFYKDHAAAE